MSLKCLNVHNYARILTLMRCIKFRTLIKVLSSKYMQGKAKLCHFNEKCTTAGECLHRDIWYRIRRWLLERPYHQHIEAFQCYLYSHPLWYIKRANSVLFLSVRWTQEEELYCNIPTKLLILPPLVLYCTLGANHTAYHFKIRFSNWLVMKFIIRNNLQSLLKYKHLLNIFIVFQFNFLFIETYYLMVVMDVFHYRNKSAATA